MFFKNYRSTKDINVFGMHQESPLSKEILNAKANREELVKAFLLNADEVDKNTFFLSIFYLETQLLKFIQISERLYLYLDNNILQDILQKNSNKERAARYYAFLALLCLAEDYLLIDIFAFIAPSVLYEYCGRKKININIILQEVTYSLAQIGLNVYFPFNADRISHLFKLIRKDEKEISKALNIIKNNSWKRNFKINGSTNRIPLSLAEEECPELKLHYFKPGVVKYLLIFRIENMMYKENKNDKDARKMMSSPTKDFFSVLNHKGNKVNGLGDIELLSSCDLLQQTSSNSPTIAMGITFDVKLQEALDNRSRTMSSTSFISGIDKPEHFTNRIMYIYKINTRVDNKLKKRHRNHIAAIKLFHNNVSS